MTQTRGPYDTSYTQEFVNRAVQYVLDNRSAPGPQRRSMRALSFELGIPHTTLNRWVKRAEAAQLRPTDGLTPRSPRSTWREDDLVDAVRDDNHRLARENAILTAALALLARDLDLWDPSRAMLRSPLPARPYAAAGEAARTVQPYRYAAPDGTGQQ